MTTSNFGSILVLYSGKDNLYTATALESTVTIVGKIFLVSVMKMPFERTTGPGICRGDQSGMNRYPNVAGYKKAGTS